MLTAGPGCVLGLWRERAATLSAALGAKGAANLASQERSTRISRRSFSTRCLQTVLEVLSPVKSSFVIIHFVINLLFISENRIEVAPGAFNYSTVVESGHPALCKFCVKHQFSMVHLHIVHSAN